VERGKRLRRFKVLAEGRVEVELPRLTMPILPSPGSAGVSPATSKISMPARRRRSQAKSNYSAWFEKLHVHFSFTAFKEYMPCAGQSGLCSMYEL
jgi:hypothetical protein